MFTKQLQNVKIQRSSGLSQKTELKLKTVKCVTSNEMEKEKHIFSDKLKPYVCLYLCMQSLKGDILESVPTILCVPLNLPFYLFILTHWVKLSIKNTAVVIAKNIPVILNSLTCSVARKHYWNSTKNCLLLFKQKASLLLLLHIQIIAVFFIWFLHSFLFTFLSISISKRDFK